MVHSCCRSGPTAADCSTQLLLTTKRPGHTDTLRVSNLVDLVCVWERDWVGFMMKNKQKKCQILFLSSQEAVCTYLCDKITQQSMCVRACVPAAL